MRTATLDLNSRGSFVDDLNSKPGIVMCRDALLHRSHEIQPAFFDSEKKRLFFFFFSFFFFYFCRDLFLARFKHPDRERATWCHEQHQGSRGVLYFFFFLRLELILWGRGYNPETETLLSSYLLGLLAKIKCSICSYQLNLWYVAHGVT